MGLAARCEALDLSGVLVVHAYLTLDLRHGIPDNPNTFREELSVKLEVYIMESFIIWFIIGMLVGGTLATMGGMLATWMYRRTQYAGVPSPPPPPPPRPPVSNGR